MARILIVDDDKSVLGLLKKLFERLGHEVVAKESAEAAIAWSGALPDLAVIDLALPGLSGEDLACLLLNAHATRGLPIIFVSGDASEKRRFEKVAQLGRLPFFKKPLDLNSLLATALALLPDMEAVQPRFISRGSLTLDLHGRRVLRGTWSTSLPRVLFRLMRALMAAAGPMNCQDLGLAIWRRYVERNRVDVAVQRLRERLAPLGKDVIISFDNGFRLIPPDRGDENAPHQASSRLKDIERR